MRAELETLCRISTMGTALISFDPQAGFNPQRKVDTKSLAKCWAAYALLWSTAFCFGAAQYTFCGHAIQK